MSLASGSDASKFPNPDGVLDTEEMEQEYFNKATNKQAFEDFDDEDGNAMCSLVTPEFGPDCTVIFTDTIKFSRDPATNLKVFNDDYLVIKEIGEGSFSHVKIIRKISDSTQYALKVYNKLSLESQKKIDFETGKWVNLLERAEREILAWSHIGGHRHVARLYEITEQAGKTHLYLRCELGDLGHPTTFDCKIRAFSWNPEVLSRLSTNGLATRDEAVKNFFYQMLEGVEYMHLRGVAHRDIKLENLVITKELRLLWIDFNSSKPFNEETLFTEYEGTLHYAAPECLWGLSEGYSPIKADVWALGVCLYALHFGCLPLDINPDTPDLAGNEYAYEMDMNIKIRDQAIDFRVEVVDPVLEDLLKHMLIKSPAERYTLEQVKAHKFLENTKLLAFQLEVPAENLEKA